MPRVEIYSIDYCSFCSSAKALLQRKGVGYIEHNLSNLSDAEMRNTVRALCARTTVPQIWINGRHIGGCTDLEALDRNGELDRMLATEAA